MDAVLLGRLKEHCHVDHDGDDGQLKDLYAAAVEYLAAAGVPEATNSGSARYQLTAFSLVLEWYDGQAALGTATIGVQRLINQLKLAANPSF